MYKETLDILLEDINDHNNVKTQILKNQLKYHFVTKNEERKQPLDCSAAIVRRILDGFNLSNIIGIQPITDKKNPTVLSGGLEYNVDLEETPYRCYYPVFESASINFECEINQAIADEIESEVISTYLNIIAEYAPEIKFTLKNAWERESLKALTAVIEQATYKIKANWMVVSPMILSLLQSNPDAVYETSSKRKFTMGDLMHVGSFNGVDTYCSLYLPENGTTILVGYKDPETEDAAIVFAPETLIRVGVKMHRVLEDGRHEFYPLSSKYAKFIHMHDVKNQYRKISIKFNNGVDI